MTITAELCETIAATRYDDIGQPAIDAARRLVLDGLAIAVAGAAEEEAISILASHYRDQGGAAQATAIGHGFRLNTVAAAALNGAAMHVLDYEPMWSPANHALSTTLAGTLALGEALGSSGREVITALVKGIELQGWIRQASGQYEATTMRLHAPGSAGPFGAAVAAGHLLGLGADQLAHAIGISASRAASVLANVGTMTKSTHCGQAASLGLEAALLAARGFTANADTFGAKQGYADTFHADFDAQVLRNYGQKPWRIVTPGYAIKMFPSQYGTHFGITAGLELHAKLPAAREIRSVVLTAPIMRYVDRPRPKTGLDGKFSLQYTAAAALLDGRVDIATFSDARLFQPDMQDLLAKIEVRQDASIPGRFEDMHVDLEVTLVDGNVLTTRCTAPRGKWGTPPIAAAEHLVKVRDCFSRRLDPATTEEVVGLASRMETLDAAQVRTLMQHVGCFERSAL